MFGEVNTTGVGVGVRVESWAILISTPRVAGDSWSMIFSGSTYSAFLTLGSPGIALRINSTGERGAVVGLK